MCIVGRMVTFFLQKPLEFPWDLASNWGCKAPDNSKKRARAFWKQCSHRPTPAPLKNGIRGVPAVRLTPGKLLAMSDARIKVACLGHGRQSLFLKMKKQNKKLVSHGLHTLLFC